MKIVKQSLGSQIYKQLKMEILSQEIAFGSKLINRQLQKRFDVSSSPIRDAINRLYNDGLISSISQSGATVISLNLEFYLEVNEILLVIAAASVRLAGKKSDVKKIVPKLQRQIAMQEKYAGTSKYFEYDYKFHKIFIDASENSRMKNIFKQYNVLHEILVRHFYSSKTKELQMQSIKMHKEILSAFSQGNFSLARQLMEEHYEMAEKIFYECMKEQEEQNQ